MIAEFNHRGPRRLPVQLIDDLLEVAAEQRLEDGQNAPILAKSVQHRIEVGGPLHVAEDAPEMLVFGDEKTRCHAGSFSDASVHPARYDRTPPRVRYNPSAEHALDYGVAIRRKTRTCPGARAAAFISVELLKQPSAAIVASAIYPADSVLDVVYAVDAYTIAYARQGGKPSRPWSNRSEAAPHTRSIRKPDAERQVLDRLRAGGIGGQARRRPRLARQGHPAMGGVARRTSADLVHGRHYARWNGLARSAPCATDVIMHLKVPCAAPGRTS